MTVTLCSSLHLNRTPLFHDRTRELALNSDTIAQQFLPMGLLSLAQSINRNGQIANIIDLNRHINEFSLQLDGNFYQNVARMILKEQPKIIGFMTDSDSLHHTIAICDEVKKTAAKTVIVLGGVHPTMLDREILSSLSCIDYVFRGEGEVYFPQLVSAVLNGGSVDEVPNVSFYRNGKFVRNPQGPLIEDLDDLPFPNLSLFPVRDADDVWIEAGRGCPFKCSFCVTAPFWQRKHRVKSARRLVDEIGYFIDSTGRNHFNLTHDLFTTKRKWVVEVCHALIAENLGVTWACSSRTDTIDEGLIDLLYLAGCRDIFFGIETGSNQAQKSIEKGLDLDRGRQIIGYAREAGIGVTLGFISGLPGETATTLRSTLKEFSRYMGAEATTCHIFGYSPYKGSPVFSAIEETLTPDTLFVDFPLPKKQREMNSEAILRHPAVYSRWTRLQYKELDLNLIRASEEYAPILGSVPMLYQLLVHFGIDELDLLSRWALWIQNENDAESLELRTYEAPFGTIMDFLNFVGEEILAQNVFSLCEQEAQYLNFALDFENTTESYRHEYIFGNNNVSWVDELGKSQGAFINPTISYKKVPMINSSSGYKDTISMGSKCIYFDYSMKPRTRSLQSGLDKFFAANAAFDHSGRIQEISDNIQFGIPELMELEAAQLAVVRIH